MAICDVCNRQMLTAYSCSEREGHIPYGQETVWAEYNIRRLPARCHDCNVKLGAFHHVGCDVEEAARFASILMRSLDTLTRKAYKP
jgi:hypothetical protein